MYYIAEVMVPVVVNVIAISSISPRVAEYSALSIMIEELIFFADCEESGKAQLKHHHYHKLSIHRQ